MHTGSEEISLIELAGEKSPTQSPGEGFTTQVKDQRPDPPVRGEHFLRTAGRWFNELDQLVERFIPPSLNPFTQSGAIANTTFIIALVTGFVLLLWYKPSVYQAYDSIQKMGPVGNFMRALHRYSSDACMLFILYHAFKMFFARRFGGSRWLAWVTGIAAVALLWFDGWLGYWLVWDERANQIAVGTAKMLDYLPIFAEPVSRSFLTGDSFNSLLFFLVFFIHMLIPLAMGIALWLHVARLNKANFITGKPMTLVVVGSLSLLALLLPADLTGPAQMLETQQSMPIDYFYLLPVFFTDRLEGGFLWILALLGFITFISIPWVLVKRNARKPSVDPNLCNGCEQCYKDCPYNAIIMLPRAEEDNKKGTFFASIDPDKCIACGICVGSCDPVGIEFPRLPAMEVRRQIDEWLENYLGNYTHVHVAYICSNSAGADLHVDESTGRCKELPGYLVRSVPCAGWVHPLMVERALRKGAEGVLVIGCQSEPDYRLGSMWTRSRLQGERHPSLRKEKVNPEKIRYLQYDRTRYDNFIQKARDFRRSSRLPTPANPRTGKTKSWLMGAALVLMTGFLTYFFSQAPYEVPLLNQSELVVSFTLPGRPVDNTPTDQSGQQNLLPHMRRSDVPAARERSKVRLRLVMDGKTVLEKRYKPKGFFNDGTSSAVEYLPVEPGTHTVEVYLGDTTDGEWLYTDQKTVDFKVHHRTVVRFSRSDLFKWYPTSSL